MRIINAVIYVLREIDPVWWALIAALAAALVAARHKARQQAMNLLAVYVAAVFVITVLGRTGVEGAGYSDLVNLDLIGTWTGRIGGDEYDRRELFLNFFMLMPAGFLFPAAAKKKLVPTLIFCFLLTLSVETLQLLTRRGWFELNDIADNTVGAVIGYGLYRLVSFLWRKVKCKRNN